MSCEHANTVIRRHSTYHVPTGHDNATTGKIRNPEPTLNFASKSARRHGPTSASQRDNISQFAILTGPMPARQHENVSAWHHTGTSAWQRESCRRSGVATHAWGRPLGHDSLFRQCIQPFSDQVEACSGTSCSGTSSATCSGICSGICSWTSSGTCSGTAPPAEPAPEPVPEPAPEPAAKSITVAENP